MAQPSPQVIKALNRGWQDLETIRQGRLTNEQKTWLRETVQSDRQRTLRSTLIPLGIGAVMILLSIFATDSRTGLLVLGSLLIVLSVIFANFSRHIRHQDNDIVRDIANGVLGIKRGKIHKVKPYVVQMGELEFSILPEMYYAFEEGGVYTLYFTPLSKQLLLAEIG